MTVALRLLSRDQINALRECQLHEVLCRDYHEQVVAALSPLDAVYVGDSYVCLDEVQRLVLDRLRSISGLEDKIIDAVEAGGLNRSIREPELWLALACWVVENQLDGRPDWNPTKRPNT
jgi:hypothetical protein